MNRTSSPILALLALVAVTGCNPPAPAPAVDAAVPVDAAEIVDAGPPDTGVTLCAEITSFGPMPASCLPRCSAETFTAYRACTDVPCIMRVLAADTTPTVTMGTPDGNLDFQCGERAPGSWSCVQWQTYVIFAALCPGDYAVYVNCGAAGGTCEAENERLATCAQADPMFRDMYFDLVPMCFASP